VAAGDTVSKARIPSRTAFEQAAALRLLRQPELIAVVGLSRMTIEREIAAGRFPRPIYPTPATKAWRSDEVDAWIASRTQARDESQAA
jgi:prophage regulatory protein